MSLFSTPPVAAETQRQSDRATGGVEGIQGLSGAGPVALAGLCEIHPGAGARAVAPDHGAGPASTAQTRDANNRTMSKTGGESRGGSDGGD